MRWSTVDAGVGLGTEFLGHTTSRSLAEEAIQEYLEIDVQDKPVIYNICVKI